MSVSKQAGNRAPCDRRQRIYAAVGEVVASGGELLRHSCENSGGTCRKAGLGSIAIAAARAGIE